MHDFARCVVKKRGNQAEAALMANATNREISADYRRLIDSNCMRSNSGMVFKNDLFRYALADALVNEQFNAEGPDDFSDRAPLEHVAAPTQAQIDGELTKIRGEKARQRHQESNAQLIVNRWLSQFGECVVRHDPVKSRQWLLSNPGTPEETASINALQPAFNACLGSGTLTFNRTVMRGTVALNYFRLAKSPSNRVSERAN